MEVAGGLPSSDTAALEAWGAAEGGSFKNTAYGNVLNSTRKTKGVASINTGTQGDIQSFAIPGQTQAQDWQEGIDENLATIGQSNMSAIANSLTGGNASATLPSALESDPWGTNGASVANILGENPDTLTALASAPGNAQNASGGNGVVLTSLGSSLVGGTADAFFGISKGGFKSLAVRGAFALFGAILLLIAFREMFSDNGAADVAGSVGQQTLRVVTAPARAAKKVAPAAAVA